MIKYPLESCTYETPDVDASIAASLPIIYNNFHINASSLKPKPLKIDHPWIGKAYNKKIWDMLFKDSTEVSESEKCL